jgi:hypothetical protein
MSQYMEGRKNCLTALFKNRLITTPANIFLRVQIPIHTRARYHGTLQLLVVQTFQLDLRYHESSGTIYLHTSDQPSI